MNRTLLAIVAASCGWICMAGAAEEAAPRNPLVKATQEEANSFFGMSEQELITAVGYPFEVTFPTGAAGAVIKYYTYISDSRYQTTFTISAERGSVIGGILKGTVIRNPDWKPPTPGAGGQAVGGGRISR